MVDSFNMYLETKKTGWPPDPMGLNSQNRDSVWALTLYKSAQSTHRAFDAATRTPIPSLGILTSPVPLQTFA